MIGSSAGVTDEQVGWEDVTANFDIEREHQIKQKRALKRQSRNEMISMNPPPNSAII